MVLQLYNTTALFGSVYVCVSCVFLCFVFVVHCGVAVAQLWSSVYVCVSCVVVFLFLMFVFVCCFVFGVYCGVAAAQLWAVFGNFRVCVSCVFVVCVFVFLCLFCVWCVL